MLRPYIIGTYEGLKSRRIMGTYCIYVSSTAEAAMQLRMLFNNGVPAIYITEEFYYDIRRHISEINPNNRHFIKLLPSSRSGDIGTIRDIKLQAQSAQRSGSHEKDSLAI